MRCLLHGQASSVGMAGRTGSGQYMPTYEGEGGRLLGTLLGCTGKSVVGRVGSSKGGM